MYFGTAAGLNTDATAGRRTVFWMKVAKHKMRKAAGADQIRFT